MSRILAISVVLLILANAAGRAAENPIIAPGAKLTVLAGGFDFTEGPACDAQGNVYFTDQPNNRIMKWSTDGKLSTFMKPCGRSNGLASTPRATSGPAPTKRTRCGGSTRRARSPS